MTFDRMQDLLAQIITLESAFGYYNMFKNMEQTKNLRDRLAIDYDTDLSLEDDCLAILKDNTKLLERFDEDTKDEYIHVNDSQQLNSDNMEFEHLDMPIKRHLITSWCVGCRYFNGVQSGNCSAYPNGIPERYADAYSGTMPDKHDSVQDDQVGEYTFINDAWSK